MNFLRRRKQSSEDDDLVDSALASTSQVHKSRKPPNTAFRQQRLKAWQPILTPKTVIPFLFLLAVVFAPLGIVIIYATYNVQKLEVDYSKCGEEASDSFQLIPSKYTLYHFQGTSDNPDFKWKLQKGTDAQGDESQTCVVQFNLPKDIDPPIYLYYKLTNFYQNHRKYVESYDVKQLRGEALKPDDLDSHCKPLRLQTVDGVEKAVYPCGLIANSYFNDTFSSPVLLNLKSGSDNETYILSEEGITWPSDKSHKFKKTSYSHTDIVPPPNWAKMFPDGYNETNVPNVHEWEHLHNWMRTAGLPEFLKLYSKNTTEKISSGTYEMNIGMNYPVTIFGGTKSLVISTNSVLGGRNLSLGVIYIIVAVISLVCAIAFFLQHLIKPRKVGDHNFLQQDGGAFRDGQPVAFREQL